MAIGNKTITKTGDKKNKMKLVGIKLTSEFLEKEEKLKEYYGCINSAELYRRFISKEYREIFEDGKN